MRLIDADRFKNWLMENYVCYDHTIADIDAQPTIEAEPVRHGKWEKIGTIANTWLVHKCSICGYQTIDNGQYCTNCGAKMDEVNDE